MKTRLHRGGGDVYWDGAHYDAFNQPCQSDIPFYLKQAKLACGPVLELACGTGRLTLPLARAGADITGLDLSAAMLKEARAKAAAAGLSVEFVKGDARRFRLGRKFRLIFFPFNSMQHLHARRDLEGLFACVKAHLAPGGRFIFDVFNPDPRYLSRDTEELLPVAYYDIPGGGGKMLVNEQYSYDKAAQVSRILWHYRREKDGKTLKKQLDLRSFYPQELQALVHYNGFKAEAVYGDFKGAKFGHDSPKQVFVLKKRP
jgi:SAM-dependent methyltransferase